MTGRDLTTFPDQAGAEVRLEWGPQGLRTLAPGTGGGRFGADVVVACDLDACAAVPVLADGAFVAAA